MEKRQRTEPEEQMAGNMLRFALPMMLSNLFSHLYNAADTAVIGRFGGTAAMAAVGATSSVIILFNWGLSGLSVGAEVLASRRVGQRDDAGIGRTVNSAYCLAVLAGMLVSAFGEMTVSTIFRLMGTPDDILPDALLYIRVIFVGMTFQEVFQFGAALLRAAGDSRRPTFFQIISGFLNVVLNLLFVCAFRMGVAGVAVATVISEIFSALAVTVLLLRENGAVRLRPGSLRLELNEVREILSIGFPSALQNMLFSLSNIAVQSSINAFGTVAVAANSAATTLESFVYVGTTAVSQTCVSFTGRSYGARKLGMLKRILIYAVIFSTAGGFTIGVCCTGFGKILLALLTTDPEVIVCGQMRLEIVALWLFLNGVMDDVAASLRGMGHSVGPTLLTLAGVCGFRLLWLATVAKYLGTLQSVYLCFPLSWLLTGAALFLMWRRVYRRELMN